VAPPNEEGTRATILKWCKSVGDAVVKDEPLVELETDKVTVEVPAPASGTLIEVLKAVSAEVSPDEVLARLQLAGAAASAPGPSPGTAARSRSGASGNPTGANAVAAASSASRDAELLSPSVRRLLKMHSLALGDIRGTGRNGRVTAQDVARHVTQARTEAETRPRAADSGSRLVSHTPIRRRVADHMVRSLV